MATCTPTTATKGFRQRSRPQPVRPQADSSSNASSHHHAAAAKLSKLEVALLALDAESLEGKYLKSVIDKTRVRAGQGHPGKRLDECQQYMVRAGKRLELAKQAVAPQLRNRIVCKKTASVRQVGGVEKGGFRHPTPDGGGHTSDRIQQFEAMVAELRRDRSDLRSHSAASK